MRNSISTQNRKNRNTNKKFNKSYALKKKGIDDYNFYIGASKQALDNEVTSEFIIDYIKRTFQRGNDIAESLRTLSLYDTDKWKPNLTASKAEDEDIAKVENKQFKKKSSKQAWMSQ